MLSSAAKKISSSLAFSQRAEIQSVPNAAVHAIASAKFEFQFVVWMLVERREYERRPTQNLRWESTARELVIESVSVKERYAK